MDHLPVLVSGKNISRPRDTYQLLGVPLLSGTRAAQAHAVYQHQTEWQIQDYIIGMAFDTFVTNTGR